MAQGVTNLGTHASAGITGQRITIRFLPLPASPKWGRCQQTALQGNARGGRWLPSPKWRGARGRGRTTRGGGFRWRLRCRAAAMRQPYSPVTGLGQPSAQAVAKHGLARERGNGQAFLVEPCTGEAEVPRAHCVRGGMTDRRPRAKRGKEGRRAGMLRCQTLFFRRPSFSPAPLDAPPSFRKTRSVERNLKHPTMQVLEGSPSKRL